MQELKELLKSKLASGAVSQILGWKAGETALDPEPAFFKSPESLDEFVYNGFCGANLSKYLIGVKEPTLVLLKPCDSYSFNQLVKEHRIDPQMVTVLGVGCKGKLDPRKCADFGVKGILNVTVYEAERVVFDTVYGEKTVPYDDMMLERCSCCKGKTHVVECETWGESRDTHSKDRMTEVKRIEAMSSAERFAFFQSQLSKCIRCNACRNVCPACSCRKCVFDGTQFDAVQKANPDPFQEKMFHIIRAFHVTGRCTDCGECSRVCPERIPLHLLNRKFLQDANDLFGEFVPGADDCTPVPLNRFEKDDPEPNDERGRCQ